MPKQTISSTRAATDALAALGAQIRVADVRTASVVETVVKPAPDGCSGAIKAANYLFKGGGNRKKLEPCAPVKKVV